jgi:hypothetical protein
MLDTFFKECFISGLKEEICAQSLNGSSYYLVGSLSKSLGSPKGGECSNKKEPIDSLSSSRYFPPHQSLSVLSTS